MFFSWDCRSFFTLIFSDIYTEIAFIYTLLKKEKSTQITCQGWDCDPGISYLRRSGKFNFSAIESWVGSVCVCVWRGGTKRWTVIHWFITGPSPVRTPQCPSQEAFSIPLFVLGCSQPWLQMFSMEEAYADPVFLIPPPPPPPPPTNPPPTLCFLFFIFFF